MFKAHLWAKNLCLATNLDGSNCKNITSGDDFIRAILKWSNVSLYVIYDLVHPTSVTQSLLSPEWLAPGKGDSFLKVGCAFTLEFLWLIR